MDPSVPQPSSASRDPPATGPQIRSRVTVVCAECKRLKLKCDRNTPCGSCTKRNTVDRCTYSPAAAEKVDLHSLNNRMIQVETFLAMLTAGQPLPAFQSTYPLVGNLTHSSGPSVSPVSSTNRHHYAASGVLDSRGNDSIALSAHDVASIWFKDLDLGMSWPHSSSSSSVSSSSYSSNFYQPTSTSFAGDIKPEPSPIEPGPSFSNVNRVESGNNTVIDVDNANSYPTRPPSSRSSLTSRAASRTPLRIDFRSERDIEHPYFRPQEVQSQHFLQPQKRRPLFAPIYLPALSIYYPASPPSMSSSTHHRRSSGQSDGPSSSLIRPSPHVTPALLSLLPPLATCQGLLRRARDVVRVRPVVFGPMSSCGPREGGYPGWSDFERRCLIFLGAGGDCFSARENQRNFEQGRKQRERELSVKERERKEKEKEKAKKARQIYFAGLQPPLNLQNPPQQRNSRHQNQSPSRSQDSVMADHSVAGDSENGRERGRSRDNDGGTMPSLTFFAAMCAMLAVGASAVESSLPHLDHPNASYGSPSNASSAGRGPTTPPLSSSPSSSSTGAGSASPAFFYALSQQALGVWDTHISSSMGVGESEVEREKERTDYILACILGVGYLLSRRSESAEEDLEGGREKEKREGVIYALVGKMVNVARSMGLGRDDPARMSLDGRRNQRELQKEEWRRMLWWEVMFYDFFIADAFGRPQYVSASSYKTKLPACSEPSRQRVQRQARGDGQGMEEDRDDLESSSSSMDMMISPRLQQPAETVVDPTYRYLGARYRFVQLAQTIKTRIAHPDCCCGYTFDQAVGLESDIRRWESEALASLQQDREQEVDRPIVQTQKFEHTLMANLLLVKVYSPFLRQAPAGSAATGGAGPSSSSPLPTATSSPAAQTSVGAAHAILRAAKSLHSITSAGNGIVMLPTMLDFYPLDKLVFDSVVVCAHASLTGKVPYPSSFVGGGGVADGSTLLEDVMSGIHLLSEIGVSDEQMRSVVDAIRKRVVSRGVEVSAGYPANVLKRKHDQVDMGIATDRGSTDGAPAGSSNPALTPSAFDPGNNNSNSGPDQRQRHRHGALSDSTANTSELPPTEQHGKKDKSAKAVSQSKEREKKDNKKPKQGIRLRPGKDHLAAAKARAQPAAIQPPFTSKPRPLPTADTVLTFQQQQKQELQSRSQSQSVSAVAASTTSSAAESPGAPAASGDGTRSRSNSFSHVQKSEPRQGSQQAERIDGGSQYTFGIPPIQESMHAVQRSQFGIAELNLPLPPPPPQQPPQQQQQHISSEAASTFVPQMFPVYQQPQASYDERRNTSPADGMGYSALSSPFSNAGPSPPASSSTFASTNGGLPPTPTFGPRHPVPPTFGPQQPVAASSATSTTYISQQYGEASYTTASASTSNFIGEMEMDHSSLYDKSHMYDDKPHLYDDKSQLYDSKPHLYDSKSHLYDDKSHLYDVKPPMENQTHHHLFRQEQQQQPQSLGSPFYEVHNMSTHSHHPHSLPMGMGAPPWPPSNEHHQEQQQSALSSQPFNWGSGRDLQY